MSRSTRSKACSPAPRRLHGGSENAARLSAREPDWWSAPQLAVEIISRSDERDLDWEGKLQKYRRLGVQELVRSDAEGEQPSLRIWNAELARLRG